MDSSVFISKPPQYSDNKYHNIIFFFVMNLNLQVNFLTKLVALRPGKTVQEMIKNVMQGKDEGADNSSRDEEDNASDGVRGRVRVI